ncbi:histidine-rich glycoprotein-like isoform X1 [Scylla paramamosain]|uniref:histidine-rich glycoprotein-like isoform X1 n=1 Tax=Scylla paramamosain TaxID=85552 RepID=UPI003083C517
MQEGLAVMTAGCHRPAGHHRNQMQHQCGSPNTSPHTGGVDLPCEHLPSCVPALNSPPGDIRLWMRGQESQCSKYHHHHHCHHHHHHHQEHRFTEDKRTSQPAHHTQVNNHSVVTAEKHNQHDPFSPESQRIPKSVEDQILTRTGWHLTVFNRLKGFSMEHC